MTALSEYSRFSSSCSVYEGCDSTSDLTEAPPKVVTQPIPQDKKAIIRHLERNSPETLALVNDWDDIAHKLMRSQDKVKQ
jgi:U3 small nucleolar RNA-associated protein 3